MKAKLLPDVEELKKMFYLDSSIPNGLRWNIKPAMRILINSPAGGKRQDGYFVTGIARKFYLNHRIIYSIANNVNLLDNQIIDHIDRQPQNNHPNNLRIVTRTENNRNVSKQKNTRSKYIGISFHKVNANYMARITVNKTRIHIGSFNTEKDAAIAYNNYIISHNLSHFNLNLID